MTACPKPQFSRMIPGLLAMFSKEGWLVILWGIVFLPIGFAIQALALIKARLFPAGKVFYF